GKDDDKTGDLIEAGLDLTHCGGDVLARGVGPLIDLIALSGEQLTEKSDFGVNAPIGVGIDHQSDIGSTDGQGSQTGAKDENEGMGAHGFPSGYGTCASRAAFANTTSKRQHGCKPVRWRRESRSEPTADVPAAVALRRAAH